jgi:hypothetical protein
MTEAPRWRLNSAHYLNVPTLPDGTRVEWEHKETNMLNGRSIRKLFTVPILLNPNDSADHNYPGEIIVAQFTEGAKIPSQDYIFIGKPTPEMEPLNDPAQAITDECRVKWDNPMSADGLARAGQLDAREQSFLDMMTKAFAGMAPAANQSVPKEQYDALLARVAALEGKTEPKAAERRV